MALMNRCLDLTVRNVFSPVADYLTFVTGRPFQECKALFCAPSLTLNARLVVQNLLILITSREIKPISIRIKCTPLEWESVCKRHLHPIRYWLRKIKARLFLTNY